MFVVIEGPNGVGKSSVAAALRDQLEARGESVLLTAEPTHTTLGTFVRQAEANLTARALAFLVAADRAEHLATVVEPALAAGRHVVSDRYVPSSLVLQQLDGLTYDEVDRINYSFDRPDLVVLLDAPTEVLDERLARRSHLTRLEGRAAAERALYRQVADRLRSHGWLIIELDGSEANPSHLATSICEAIDSAR